MKKPSICCLVLLVAFLVFLRFSELKAQTLYNEDFNWEITVPNHFNSVSPDDWARMQNKGEEAIENTYGEEVINQAKTIFVFKNADYNYFESNYQPFDIEVDGDYPESCKNVNEMLYETIAVQMPGTRVDSLSSVENISGLKFQTFIMKVEFPNGLVLQTFLYSRLFGTKEFSVNITYVNEEQGRAMLKSWKESKFK